MKRKEKEMFSKEKKFLFQFVDDHPSLLPWFMNVKFLIETGSYPQGLNFRLLSEYLKQNFPRQCERWKCFTSVASYFTVTPSFEWVWPFSFYCKFPEDSIFGCVRNTTNRIFLGSVTDESGSTPFRVILRSRLVSSGCGDLYFIVKPPRTQFLDAFGIQQTEFS